ncbi:MAG: hypothetical protein RIR59_302 [Pseudomonadota bacterium]|jgi:hypothetical protein
MLTVTMDADAGFLELTVDGPIGDDDYKKAVDAVDQLLTRHPKIDIVEVVKEIGWIDPGVWFKDLTFHLTHRNFMRHVAIVSDKAWVGPLSSLLAPLYPATIRNFHLAELDDARRWVRTHGDPDAPEAEPHLDFA